MLNCVFFFRKLYSTYEFNKINTMNIIWMEFSDLDISGNHNWSRLFGITSMLKKIILWALWIKSCFESKMENFLVYPSLHWLWRIHIWTWFKSFCVDHYFTSLQELIYVDLLQEIIHLIRNLINLKFHQHASTERCFKLTIFDSI